MTSERPPILRAAAYTFELNLPILAQLTRTPARVESGADRISIRGDTMRVNPEKIPKIDADAMFSDVSA